jgi:hypothetical protein
MAGPAIKQMFGTDARFPLPPLSWGASEPLLDVVANAICVVG